MFDPSNHSIILCSPELERVLNMKALHVTEFRFVNIPQITSLDNNSIPLLQRTCFKSSYKNPR